MFRKYGSASRFFTVFSIIFFDPYIAVQEAASTPRVWPALHAIVACRLSRSADPGPAHSEFDKLADVKRIRDGAQAGIWQRNASTAATLTRSADLPATFAKFKSEICMKRGRAVQLFGTSARHLRFKN